MPDVRETMTPATAAPRINDFALKLANVNGTGSASANGLLMQAIFRMGIPVSGKNLFPSNIQGLPTWYEIRVNAAGHVARTPDFDLFVAMNSETYAAACWSGAEASVMGVMLRTGTRAGRNGLTKTSRNA